MSLFSLSALEGVHSQRLAKLPASAEPSQTLRIVDLSEISARRSNRRGVSGRRIPGVGAPLNSRGGRQGIGHQSYFPGGLLTTAQLVGYLKPVTGWNSRLAMARCAASCDW